jgi:hypothetical protein
MKHTKLTTLMLLSIALGISACSHAPNKTVHSFHPELAYLEQMQSYGPHQDTRIPMLLSPMGAKVGWIL